MIKNEEHVFLLQDYELADKYWRVEALNDLVLNIQPAERGKDEVVHGVLNQWTLAGEIRSMGFISNAELDGVPNVPNYKKNLIILVNKRLLRDGYIPPKLHFREGIFRCHFSAVTDKGWSFQIDYKMPWFRELFRKLNLGGTIEYDPVDFIKRLVEVVDQNKGHWLTAVGAEAVAKPDNHA